MSSVRVTSDMLNASSEPSGDQVGRLIVPYFDAQQLLDLAAVGADAIELAVGGGHRQVTCCRATRSSES